VPTSIALFSSIQNSSVCSCFLKLGRGMAICTSSKEDKGRMEVAISPSI
jgi:hypothetical protein